MPIELVCLDADDTLWHNMRHFAAAEHALFAILAPFAEAGVSRAALDAVEERNLRLYGYGAKGFTLSMIEAAVELVGPALTAGAVAEILRVGRDLLAHPVELLPGVEAALDLQRDARVASSARAGRRAADVPHGIACSSERAEKPDALSVALARVGPEGSYPAGLLAPPFGRSPPPAGGRGPRRCPSRAEWAAHVPHGIAWPHERAGEPDHPRFRRLTALADLPGWIDAIGRGP